MVKLHVKKNNESQFLYETNVNILIHDLLKELLAIYNGRLKITRLCYEIEELSKYGISLPPNMQGLTQEQILDLKLKDEWSENNLSHEQYIYCPDPMGKRNGKAPNEKYAEVLTKTTAEAKARISKKLIDGDVCLKISDVEEAINILNGALMITYPMGLPSYEIIKQEMENDYSSSQMNKDILEEGLTELWWAGKQLEEQKKLYDYVGKNEKSKLIVKLQKKGHGAPSREPVLTEQQRKELMLAQYQKQEELKRLEEADDDSYLDSQWADNNYLKKTFLGMNKIKFK